jgi:hypothetical protein
MAAELAVMHAMFAAESSFLEVSIPTLTCAVQAVECDPDVI